ncbi:unnamed protein product [Sphagnum jensenii]|uniref:Uncharacterized protein n=1 Tax=Sphagnum jensenii TaxID=128206 RepID=A0ABP0WMA2_9BRYO
MGHSNLNKLPAGPADEAMQVEAAEDENPPPVLSEASETSNRVPIPAIPGAPQPPMGEMTAPPTELCWLHVVEALLTMPPLRPGAFLHYYTRSNLPGWRGAVSAFHDYALAEYSTRLAADPLNGLIVQVLASIAQQAALEYRAETANVAEGADGTVVEAGIADAILQLEDRETLRPHEDGPNNNGNA